MSTISIVVPVYKVEGYLEKCILSILNQDFSDFDLVLVDDGSPDNCGKICDIYALQDARITVIHQENGGLSAARNTGIDWVRKHSDSRWITFIDSDDYVHQSYLSVLYNGTLAKNSVDVVICDHLIFNNTVNQFENVSSEFQVLSGKSAVSALYTRKSKIHVTAWGKLYNKRLFDTIRFPVGRIHEDQARIPIVLYNASSVAVTKDKLYFYRCNENSIMNQSFSLKRYDDITAIDECISFFKKNNENIIVKNALTEKKEILCRYSLYARKAGIYNQVNKKYKITIISALHYLSNNISDDSYTYLLKQTYSVFIIPHAYIRKIKKTLGIKVTPKSYKSLN